MPNSTKLLGCTISSSMDSSMHATAREQLMMSVIVEEPVHMRESRLKEQEKHPEDIKPSSDSFLKAIEERPRRSATRARSTGHAVAPSPECPVSRSDSVMQSRSVSSSASTTPSSSDDGYKQNKSRISPVALSPSGTSRLESRHNLSSESRSRHHLSSNRHVNDPRSYEGSSHRLRSDPEYTHRLKSSHSFSSSSEENEASKHHQRPPHRHANLHSSTRPKASSIPPSNVSSSSRRERTHGHQSPPHPTTSSPYNSSDEMPRSKSTRLDSIHSEYHQRSASRQAPRPRSSSRETSHPNTPSMLPPFREPFAERDVPRLESSKPTSTSTSYSDQERRTPSREGSPTSSGDVHRVKSSSTLNSLASLTETKKYEDRRLRAFRDASPPPRQQSTSNPKLMSQTHVGAARRQVPSRRESKTPVTMNPKLMGPAKLATDQPKGSSRPFFSSRDPTRSRSTSLLPKRSPSENSIPRSASATTLSSLDAMASPHEGLPQIPLRLRHYEGRFLNRRKQTLFYFSLFPLEKMPMRGVVLCLHGIGDHCRRNVKLYERLCREGFGVITYDLLNHGVSDLDQHKTRAHISNFSHLVQDTNDFITFAKRSIYTDALRYWRKHHQSHSHESSIDSNSRPELPLIIAGTSFGSLIGLHTVLAGEHKFQAAVWGSPTIGVTWNPLLWAESKLAKPLAAIIPTAKVVPAVQHDLLCRDPKFLRRFKADPLTSMDMMTTRSGHESLQAMIQLEKDTRVTDPGSAFSAVPTLFLAGSADGISDQQAAIKFFATMGNFDKEFKLFDGLFHMVYEEPEKENVFRYLAKWLHCRFPVCKLN